MMNLNQLEVALNGIGFDQCSDRFETYYPHRDDQPYWCPCMTLFHKGWHVRIEKTGLTFRVVMWDAFNKRYSCERTFSFLQKKKVYDVVKNFFDKPTRYGFSERR